MSQPFTVCYSLCSIISIRKSCGSCCWLCRPCTRPGCVAVTVCCCLGEQNKRGQRQLQKGIHFLSLRRNFFLTACAMKCCCHELACCLLLSCCCNERSATHSQQAAKTGFGTRLCLLLDHFNTVRNLTLRHLYVFLTVLDTPKYTPYAKASMQTMW